MANSTDKTKLRKSDIPDDYIVKGKPRNISDSSLKKLSQNLAEFRQRTGRRKIDEFDVSPLYCSSEWHFARFGGEGREYTYPIYSLAFRISSDSGRFSASISTLAEYLDADPKAIRAALHLLVLAGFFKVLKAEEGKSVSYRPVPHQEWSEAHPHCCINKDVLPWSEGDKLGQDMYAASDGRYKTRLNLLSGIRKTGHSDAAILTLWREFLEIKNPEGYKWKHITGQFIKYLRQNPIDTPPS